MREPRYRLTALMGALSLGAIGAPAEAAGFGVQEISTEGLGRANAGEAARSGAGALWWNPAAVSRAGAQVSLSMHYRAVASTLTDRGSQITRPIPPAGLTLPVGGRGRVRGAFPDATLPSGALAIPIAGGVAAGVAVTHPFQLKSKFPGDSWTRYDTLRSRIDVTSVQAGLAAPLTPWLDLGAALETQHMAAYLDTASPNLNPAAPDGVQRLNGKGWDHGWTVGAQAHSETLRVGVSYRAAVKHRLNGRIAISGLQAPLDAANFQAPARTVFWTPWMLTAAAQWRASPALTLSAQLVRSGWEKYDKIDASFLGLTASIPQGYHNETSAAVGADYALSEGWTMRGGLQYDPTPSPDALREPGVADADRWIYAVGASRAFGPRAKLHAALAYSVFKASPLNDFNVFYAGTPAQTTATANGRYKANHLSVSLGVDLGF